MDKTILVTGGAGFIGKRFIEEIQGFYDIFAICRDEDIDGIPQVRGDLRSYDDVQRAIYEADPALVVHLGAVAPVGWSYRAPRQAITSNVLGAINVLDACRSYGNVPCLFVSSDKSYGDPLDTPVRESTELNPRHPYDAAKASADFIAISYACTYDLPVQIVRPCNVYGPGDQHWNRLIPGAIRAALLKQKFKLRSDGSPIRDYIYVEDIARALHLLVDTILGDEETMPGFGVWNISAKQTYSVGEVLAHIDSVLGTKLAVDITEEAEEEGETDILVVDGSLFASAFKWEPVVEFDQGIEITAAWMNTIL
jgi:CDP-glucose 4,6-dehydratase